jgi:RecA/RadA recombinase
MFYGTESSGKTTNMLKVVAGFQRKHPKKIVVWVDPENMFDRDWAKRLGCDLSRLEVIQPETGEEAVDLLVAAMSALEVGMVVLDSVPGCVPKTVVDRSAEDDTMAALARLMGKMCSKVLMAWSAERRRGHRVTLGLINQIRLKVGFVMGNPQTLPGGRQINHLPTTKVHIKNKEVKGKDSYENEVVLTNDHSFEITKAKHGASIRSGEFQMVVSPDLDPLLPQGAFDDYKTVLTYAKKFKLLAGGGGNYRLPLIAPDNGWSKHDDIIQWLKANDHQYRVLRASILACQRFSKGLPMCPPDGYLEAHGVKVDGRKLLELMGEAD